MRCENPKIGYSYVFRVIPNTEKKSLSAMLIYYKDTHLLDEAWVFSWRSALSREERGSPALETWSRNAAHASESRLCSVHTKMQFIPDKVREFSKIYQVAL